MTLQETIAELDSKSIGAVMVRDKNGRLSGIVTDGDIRRLLTSGEVPKKAIVNDIMTRSPVTISGDTMAADALSLMQQREITVLAVVATNGNLEGILHLHDLLGKGEFRFLI